MDKKKRRRNKYSVESVQEHVKAEKALRLPDDRKIEFIMLLLMSVFVFILYSNTLHYPFHFDDDFTILENTNLHIDELSIDLISKMLDRKFGHRPLPMASFAVNLFLNGHNPFGYHLVNILVHIVNGILIFYFVKTTIALLDNKRQELGKKKETISRERFYLPFFSSLIWLVHPLQTNSVTYIVQRMNSMATLFFLFCMLLYSLGRQYQHKNAAYRKQNRRIQKLEATIPYLFFGAGFIAGLLAIGSKENTAILPFFILLYEIFFFQELNFTTIKKFLLPTIGLLFLMALSFQTVIGFDFIKNYFHYYEGFPFNMSQRVLTELRVVIYYLSLFFYPHPNRLNFDYDFPLSYSLIDPITTLLSFFCIVFLIFAALFFARKERILSFGILWYFGNLIIESSILPLDIIFEHRTYLPTIFISVILVSMIWRFLGSDKLRISLLSTIIIVLCIWTYQRNSVWQSPVTLWEDCVQKSPNKDRPHADLGRSLELAGRLDEAIVEYKKTLSINPYHQFTLRNMGLALYKKGMLDEAIDYYRKAIQSDPKLAIAYNDLGVALIDQKKLEEGIKNYKKALKLKPNHPEAPGNLKKAVDGLAQINSFISKTQTKAKQDSMNPVHYQTLGFLHYRKGHFDTALEYYQKALSIDKTDSKSLKGIAAIHVERKEYDSAVSIFKQILEQNPEKPEIYYNIACVYSLQNKKNDAGSWLTKAIEKGFDKWELIKTDKDLSNIRETEAYRIIVDQNQ